MNKIEEYVEKSFKDIPDSERKEQLKQEILQNLSEKVYDLVENGESFEDAENQTIDEFGDIDDIKHELNTGSPPVKPTKSYQYRLRLWYSVCGSALIIGLLVFVNFYYGNQPVWFVYPAFGVLWWPLTMLFLWFKHK